MALSLDVLVFLYCAVACRENKKGTGRSNQYKLFLNLVTEHLIEGVPRVHLFQNRFLAVQISNDINHVLIEEDVQALL